MILTKLRRLSSIFEIFSLIFSLIHTLIYLSLSLYYFIIPDHYQFGLITLIFILISSTIRAILSVKLQLKRDGIYNELNLIKSSKLRLTLSVIGLGDLLIALERIKSRSYFNRFLDKYSNDLTKKPPSKELFRTIYLARLDYQHVYSINHLIGFSQITQLYIEIIPQILTQLVLLVTCYLTEREKHLFQLAALIISLICLLWFLFKKEFTAEILDLKKVISKSDSEEIRPVGYTLFYRNFTVNFQSGLKFNHLRDWLNCKIFIAC